MAALARLRRSLFHVLPGCTSRTDCCWTSFAIQNRHAATNPSRYATPNNNRLRCLSTPRVVAGCSTRRQVHFVSSNRDVPASTKEVERLLRRQKINFTVGHTGLSCKCFKCANTSLRTGGSNGTNLFIDKITGSYVCKMCGDLGTWFDLKNKLQETSSNSADKKHVKHGRLRNEQLIQVNQRWNGMMPWNRCEEELRTRIEDYLHIQNISDETFQRYNVHVDIIKVVLTSREIDALAINQVTGLPALTLPHGHSMLPPEVLPLLEQFSRIVFWFDNTVRAKQAMNQFSKKLSPSRCYFVRFLGVEAPVGALQAFNQGMQLNDILKSAKPLKNKQIITFSQLRADVFNEFSNPSQYSGVQWNRFVDLNNILRGHRRGELTIFTGPTGAGKTTLLSELSLDLCAQGVNTLWGSFEVKNVRLVKSMMCQLSGINLENDLSQYDHWANAMEALPLHFMDFYGSQSINKVIETMTYAAYAYDIEHIIIDNLQFMMSDAQQRFDDRFQAMNMAISEFRKFASDKNIHVTVVIHPRKENSDTALQTASIFGTAKASQEADNVMILQNPLIENEKKVLQITKNRFDGTLGSVPLEFHRDSLTLSGFWNRQSPVAQSSHGNPTADAHHPGRAAMASTVSDRNQSMSSPSRHHSNRRAVTISDPFPKGT